MAYHHLHALLDLFGVPGFPFRGINLCSHDCRPDSLFGENVFETPGHVAFARVNREHLAASTRVKLMPDFLDQLPLFGVKPVLREITWLGNDKSCSGAGLRIELGAIKCA